jgi:hypothetical protein
MNVEETRDYAFYDIVECIDDNDIFTSDSVLDEAEERRAMNEALKDYDSRFY